MRKRIIPVLLVVTFAASAALATRGVAQSPSPMGDANAEPAPFNPQMSALMSMLIQPRHIKLYIAGKAEN